MTLQAQAAAAVARSRPARPRPGLHPRAGQYIASAVMGMVPSLARLTSPEAATSDLCVVFGGTGDLSLRMLLPSLYHLEAEGRLAPSFRILAIGREPMTTNAFAAQVEAALKLRVPAEHLEDGARRRLVSRLGHLALDAADPASARRLREASAGAERPLSYLATSPTLYSAICERLREAGLAGPESRVVLEKPIGRDLSSSRRINEAVGAVFNEDRIYRIDHYLGKETVQNLLTLRFANLMFEPLWNNLCIDHVQITVAETEGVGERWRYYDEYGAARDMVQNHMLQLLALVAMEPPSDMRPDSVRSEKVKVLRSLRRVAGGDASDITVRGQYDGYPQERGGPSATETFVAIRAHIDNWRWAGTPFFLRTGKRMTKRQTQVVVQFKDVPHSAFAGISRSALAANRLVIDLQPQENIELLLMNKAPGLDSEGMDLRPLPLSLSLANAFGEQGGRRRIAYERLLLDAMHGRRTLFVGRDEVEEAWSWIDDLAAAWDRAARPPLSYAPGSWGPDLAETLIARTGRRWND